MAKRSRLAAAAAAAATAAAAAGDIWTTRRPCVGEIFSAEI